MSPLPGPGVLVTPETNSYRSFTASRRAPNEAAGDSAHDTEHRRRRLRRSSLPPPGLRGVGDRSDRSHGRRHLRRRPKRGCRRARRPRRRGHELARRVRDDHVVRISHLRPQRRQRHRVRRRQRAAHRARDRSHVSLPCRRLERQRHEPRRGRHCHHARRSGGRDGRRLGARTHRGEPRRHGSTRTVDRPAGGSSTARRPGTARGPTPARRVQAPARSVSRSGSRA